MSGTNEPHESNGTADVLPPPMGFHVPEGMHAVSLTLDPAERAEAAAELVRDVYPKGDPQLWEAMGAIYVPVLEAMAVSGVCFTGIGIYDDQEGGVAHCSLTVAAMESDHGDAEAAALGLREIFGRRPKHDVRWLDLPCGPAVAVVTEGADPAGLAALIGEEGAGLSAPTDPREASRNAPAPHEREGVELWEDRAVVAVGRTAQDWAFAFETHSHHRLNARFRSPAAAASAAGRAVVVWRDPVNRPSPDSADHPAAFHLSVAEQGEELYAFTVRGTEAERSGAIPGALDPALLFRPEDSGQQREARVLTALHAELGLSLPRFALTEGRLRTFTTRSWTREPGDDEPFGYAYVTVGQPRR